MEKDDGGGGGWTQARRSEVVELLACSKRGLCDLCVENGLDPKGNKNVLLMRLLDHKAAAGNGRAGSGTGTRHPLLLGLGVECLGLVFKSMVREEIDDDVGPVGDWRRQVVVLSKLANVCTVFRDAARLLIDPILSRGSIRDWPARQQMPLIQMMCAKRQVLRELSLTLVDEAELPLLLLLVLKCDVSALTSLKLISDMGDPRLYWMRIKKGRPEPIAIRDDSEHDNRTKTSYSFFSNMASSLGVSLPSPDFFQDEYAIAGDWAGFGRVTFQGCFPRQFLTMSLSHCPALEHLDMTGFRLDKNFFNALPGCRHLKTLKVAEIPGCISVEPWKGHGLTTLTLYRHSCSQPGLHKLLPILQSLTSLDINASEHERGGYSASDVPNLQSNSLCRFAILRKAGHYDGEVFDFPNLRAFHFEATYFPNHPFPDTRSGCRLVSFLNSYPLLEEYGLETPNWDDGLRKQVIRIPPGRPVARETLKKMREFRYACRKCLCKDCKRAQS